MDSAIVVHPDFDHTWPWAADHLREIWAAQGPLQFVRQAHDDKNPSHALLEDAGSVRKLACLGAEFTEESLAEMPALCELAADLPQDGALAAALERAGVRLIWQRTEGFWGQSVAEFALALTLCGLRRIAQTHHNMITDLADWDYTQPDGIGRPGERGQQFGDDVRFANGTLEGKRVRVVGVGNIGSRYAVACRFLGADVAAWDPLAREPCFHRSGARQEHFVERLVQDAEIFAPMLPLTAETEGLVKAEHIRALPKGCLVVMVTRARICDCEAVYDRVLADELALAADVFDNEPLEIGHPLLGRHNVVHTPHNAGRTKEANFRFAEMLAEQFAPRPAAS